MEAVPQMTAGFADLTVAATQTVDCLVQRASSPSADARCLLVLRLLQAALLVGQGGAGLIPTAGLVMGFAVAAGMLAYNTQRALNLQYNDGDWVSLSCASGVQCMCM
jgi:hypothetical protein